MEHGFVEMLTLLLESGRIINRTFLAHLEITLAVNWIFDDFTEWVLLHHTFDVDISWFFVEILCASDISKSVISITIS